LPVESAKFRIGDSVNQVSEQNRKIFIAGKTSVSSGTDTANVQRFLQIEWVCLRDKVK